MNFLVFVFWAAVGWCGNEIRRPKPPHPPTPPWLSTVLAIVGGTLGGWALNSLLLGNEMAARVDLLTTGIGALVGGIVLSSLPSLLPGAFAGRRKAATVVLRLPDTSPEAVRNIDTQTLAGTLQAILSEPASEARINEVILSGGRVRIGSLAGAPEAWQKTIWSRSGPIRPDFETNPIDIEQNLGS
jgi:hypothetical protein